MPQPSPSTSRLIIGLGLVVLLWGASIAGVYLDLKRRRVANAEVALWLAVVALLPGVGLLAYVLPRALDHYFPPAPGSFGGSLRRITQLRPPPITAPRTGTIAASDLVKETLFDRPPSPAPAAVAPPPPPALPVITVSLLLAAVAGAHAGQEFELTSLPARVGRGAAADLRLDRDLGISREHAEFYQQAVGVHLRDLHSQHGTTVNGRRITDQALQVGDRIEIGLTTLVVKRVGA